jgi:hypothetical protein
MSKNRVPSSKLSWIGMAAHEIHEITTHSPSLSARIARGLANAVVDAGHNLLTTDPRETARLNYSLEAVQVRRQRQVAREAESRRILGDDDFDAWIEHMGAQTRLAA